MVIFPLRESRTDDAQGGTELEAGFEDLLDIVSELENKKCVSTPWTATTKDEEQFTGKSTSK